MISVCHRFHAHRVSVIFKLSGIFISHYSDLARVFDSCNRELKIIPRKESSWVF